MICHQLWGPVVVSLMREDAMETTDMDSSKSSSAKTTSSSSIRGYFALVRTKEGYQKITLSSTEVMTYLKGRQDGRQLLAAILAKFSRFTHQKWKDLEIQELASKMKEVVGGEFGRLLLLWEEIWLPRYFSIDLVADDLDDEKEIGMNASVSRLLSSLGEDLKSFANHLVSGQRRSIDTGQEIREFVEAESITNTPDTRQLECVLEELLQIEGDYVDNLRILYETWVGVYPNLREEERMGLPSPAEVRLIFGGIGDIYLVNNAFYNELVEVRRRPDHQFDDLVNVMYRHVGKFEVYSKYVNFLEMSQCTLEKCVQQHEAFKDFIDDFPRKTKGRQSISDVLIQPIQRIPRYIMLLKNLLRYAPQSSSCFPKLVSTYKTMAKVAFLVNENKKMNDMRLSSFQLYNDIEDYPSVLINASRVLIGQFDIGQYEPASRTVRENFTMFILNDLIVIAKRKHKSNSKGSHTKGKRYVYERHYLLTDLYPVELEDVAEFSNRVLRLRHCWHDENVTSSSVRSRGKFDRCLDSDCILLLASEEDRNDALSLLVRTWEMLFRNEQKALWHCASPDQSSPTMWIYVYATSAYLTATRKSDIVLYKKSTHRKSDSVSSATVLGHSAIGFIVTMVESVSGNHGLKIAVDVLSKHAGPVRESIAYSNLDDWAFGIKGKLVAAWKEFISSQESRRARAALGLERIARNYEDVSERLSTLSMMDSRPSNIGLTRASSHHSISSHADPTRNSISEKSLPPSASLDSDSLSLSQSEISGSAPSDMASRLSRRYSISGAIKDMTKEAFSQMRRSIVRRGSLRRSDSQTGAHHGPSMPVVEEAEAATVVADVSATFESEFYLIPVSFLL
jgi:hypothetical protein